MRVIKIILLDAIEEYRMMTIEEVRAML